MASDPGSWTYHLGEPIEVSGGWRRDGATSRMIVANMSPETADVVVAMAGTNDISQGIPASETVSNVDQMIAAQTTHGVVLAAVPPQIGRADDVRALNSALEALADLREWLWLDPWSAVRLEDAWAPGASPDGIHGTDETYELVAREITDAVISRFSAAAATTSDAFPAS